ncbi:hypothetical protein BDV96DRAFT_179593 [Lophiotrema nucula]|uniref:Uncharacterized protein n=1 Tax=Lophiotrema nucula TaxID=690887 RepID=A0A6A5YY91_9PLEO|nr:hypothetical protein BDV96DRAFT_179593 [Lophiotrema nucula]
MASVFPSDGRRVVPVEYYESEDSTRDEIPSLPSEPEASTSIDDRIPADREANRRRDVLEVPPPKRYIPRPGRMIPSSTVRRPAYNAVYNAHMQQRFGQLQLDRALAVDTAPSMDAVVNGVPEQNISQGQDSQHYAARANHSWSEEMSAITAGNHTDAEAVLQTGIGSLQQQIKMLQDELYQLEDQEQRGSPKPYQVLYRIQQQMYFDHPEWTEGGKAIVSRVPVDNLDLFLERHKNVLFIVYRDFNDIQMPEKGSRLHQPRHSEESIHPVNKRLRSAIETVLRNNWRYESFVQKFYLTGEVKAPYLFIYHSRPYWTNLLSESPRRIREHLTIVARYVLQNYRHDICFSLETFWSHGLTVSIGALWQNLGLR